MKILNFLWKNFAQTISFSQTLSSPQIFQQQTISVEKIMTGPNHKQENTKAGEKTKPAEPC